MEISPYFLSLLLIHSLILGAVVGLVNDVHRLTRIFFGVCYSKKRFRRLYEVHLPLLNRSIGEIGTGKGRRFLLPILIFFQDVLLCGFAAVGVAVLNYYFNYGQFRAYTVIAMLVGFAVYYFTVGKLMMLFSEGVICLLRMTTAMLWFLLTRPFVLFGRGIGFFWKKIYGKIREGIEKHRKKVYNIHIRKQVMKEATVGFLPGVSIIPRKRKEKDHDAEKLF